MVASDLVPAVEAVELSRQLSQQLQRSLSVVAAAF